MTAIEFENISKQYRLGLVSTGTLSHDLNRFWQTKVLRRDDPYLKQLSRVTAPTTGTIRAQGRIASLLKVGTGFHPEMTDRENIYKNGAIMGMTRTEITRKLDEIVDFSGCTSIL